MKKAPCRILLTSVGGLSSPQMIKLLRESPFINPTVFGVDMSAHAVGSHFADGFATVPRGDSPDYVDAITGFCRRNQIEFVVPCSDAEAISLSAAVPALREHGIRVLCSDHRSTVDASNKHSFLTRLRANGVPVPQHYVPRSGGEMRDALDRLGYPRRDVIIKPLSSCGSRGVRILRADFDEFEQVFGSRQETYVSHERLVRLVGQSSTFPELLFMEHLSGGIYNVDALCEGGTCVHIVPQRKLPPEHGSVQNCVLDYDEEVESLTRRIVGIFGFDHLVNIEFGISHPENGRACLAFETNVRTSATITMTHASGCYLLEEAICRLMGIDTTRSSRRNASIKRYWTEWYE